MAIFSSYGSWHVCLKCIVNGIVEETNIMKSYIPSARTCFAVKSTGNQKIDLENFYD